MQFRLDHLADPRAVHVVETAARLAGWGEPCPDDVGRGLGFARYKDKGAWCAVVAEVEVESDVRVRRLTVVADLGCVVNPDGARNQLEGGATQATSWTIKERVRFDRRRITSDDWETYPILRFSETPRVDVHLVESDAPSLGAGEAAQGPDRGRHRQRRPQRPRCAGPRPPARRRRHRDRHRSTGADDMNQPRISYVPMDQMDEQMRTEMERCAREGTPRPESSAVRAHAPEVFKTFAAYWEASFRSGVCDHAIKELARLYITRTTNCQFCGNQRSSSADLPEYADDELLNFERSDSYDDRQKAALAYAQAIAWNESDRDGLWDRLHAHFSEPELVELGCFIALTFGQQSWIRLLDVGHQQYAVEGVDSTTGLAPGVAR